MIETVATCGYAKKLGRYEFPSNLCSTKELCEKWLDFCKRNKMKWLEGSYGTLVHKEFDKYFTNTKRETERDILTELGFYDDASLLNHSNSLESNINDVIMVTSSPNYLEMNRIKNYPYTVFIIHPSLLEDYTLSGINIAFANMTWNELMEINEAIYEGIGIYGAFRSFY